MIYTRHITFAHNTVASPTGFGTGTVRYIDFSGQGTYVKDFYFHSNIVPGKFFVSGSYNNTAAITSRFLATFFFKNNLAISSSPGDTGALPSRNFLVNSYSGLFVNEAGGDYRLKTDNAKLYPGADGRPVGADIQALDACTAGATTNWTGTCGEIITPPPGGCPAQPVILTQSSIKVGSNSLVSAPPGWYGGTFTSSDTTKATLHPHPQTLSSLVTGISAGSSSITGAGWTAANGETNCPLQATSLTVTAPGTEVLVYDWNRGIQTPSGRNIEGITTSSPTIKPFASTQTGRFPQTSQAAPSTCA